MSSKIKYRADVEAGYKVTISPDYSQSSNFIICPSLARKFRHSSEAVLIAGPCPDWCRILGTCSPDPAQGLGAHGRPHPGLPIP